MKRFAQIAFSVGFPFRWKPHVYKAHTKESYFEKVTGTFGFNWLWLDIFLAWKRINNDTRKDNKADTISQL